MIPKKKTLNVLIQIKNLATVDQRFLKEVSAKMKYGGGGDRRNKNKKVEISVGKNGGILILLGGALVTALLSSAFRKRRKSADEDECRRGIPSEPPPPPPEVEENSIITDDDEDQMRKGLQLFLSDPSSLMQEQLRPKEGEGGYDGSEEMNKAGEKDGRAQKMQEEIISNHSSIPGSATSSEQEEYSSQPFYIHLQTEDFRVAKADEAIKTALEAEAKDIPNVLPAEEEEEEEEEEIECGEKDCIPGLQNTHLEEDCKVNLQKLDEAIKTALEEEEENCSRGFGPDEQRGDDGKSSHHEEDCKVNLQKMELDESVENQQSDEVSTTTEENPYIDEAISTIQFVESQHCDDGSCKDVIFMADENSKPTIIVEEEEEDDDDISDETEESSEGEEISSDEEIWAARLRGKLNRSNVITEIEEDYTNFKDIDSRGDLKMNSIQSGTRKNTMLDNLLSSSLQSNRRILALLIAYTFFWYLGLPFFVVILAMFFSNHLLAV